MMKKGSRISFEQMLADMLQEYRRKGYITENDTIAGDLVAAVTKGARTFGLKLVKCSDGTAGVRILSEGVECTGLGKDLSARAEISEYLKAWFAAQLLAREFSICDTADLCFAMDVDEAAAIIPSQTVSDFLMARENPSATAEWKKCRRVALDHLDWFSRVDAITIYGVTTAQKIA